MLEFILWYLTLTLLGLLTFPLARHLLPALADQGYSLSRTLGLLLWGFVFWLLTSFALTQNDMGGLLLALVVVASLSAWALWRAPGSFQGGLSAVKDWFKANWKTALVVEVLFLVAFAFMAFVRANNPENVGTEKPMEMAFINAILRSPHFPPHDPWLSGYAISYYYFGYVMAAMLAKFTATSGGVAFNLMVALVFALSAIGAYGLLYSLITAYLKAHPRPETTTDAPKNATTALAALLGPLFLLIVSNVEGFLEFLHSLGVGWTGQPGDVNFWTQLGALARPNAQAYNFWTWLDIKDLNQPPAQLGWENPRFWFWWRASRVVQDYDLMGNPVEVIDEFPFFSYLLGDLHPHVLAMPFGLLAAALALNLYLGGWKGVTDFKWFKLPVRVEGLAMLAVVLGGLAFLNTWDFPIYLALVCGALILSLVQERGWDWGLVEDFFKFAIPLGIVSILLYLPFYVSFSSQAGGILPNVTFPSRGAHLWVMFGTLFVPLFFFLIYLIGKREAHWKLGFGITLAGVAFLALLSVVLGLIAASTDAGQAFISSQGLASTSDVLVESLTRRLAFGGGALTLILIIAGALAYLAATKAPGESEAGVEPVEGRSPLPFVLMFILFGGLLVLAPEFVYLRDQFGTRMNTVFKFYYQAWALWSAAAAFSVIVLLRELRRERLAVFGVALGLVLVVGLAYPILSVPVKTNNFNVENPAARTLDGSAYLLNSAPDDLAAIQWMAQAPLGVVAEAVGGSYSQFARISTYSGQPTVIGWPGHEGQWRGGYKEQGSRMQDIETLYKTIDWPTAEAIIEQYKIKYVYIGLLERGTYALYEEKFAEHLSEVYRQGQVVIYGVP